MASFIFPRKQINYAHISEFGLELWWWINGIYGGDDKEGLFDADINSRANKHASKHSSIQT
jgi:hypothetical protein